MNLIAAVDKNWAIGLRNELLVKIPADQRQFREKTEGRVVVMGRRTLESFPGGRPLKNRTNIVLTGNRNYQAEGCIIVHSTDELAQKLERYPSEEIFVIGGERVYRELLDWCDVAYITKMDKSFEADTFFPNLDQRGDWVRESGPEPEEQVYFDLIYHFLTYRRNRKK